MRTCDDHCDCVVVYDSRECPICQMEAELEEEKEKNSDLNSEVKELQEQIEKLES